MFLSALADAGPAPFPSDLAAAIRADFDKYQALRPVYKTIQITTPSQNGPAYSGGVSFQTVNMGGTQARANAALPAWYNAAIPFSNVQQGANGQTGYLSYRVLNRNGVKLWEVAQFYGLNRGTQTISGAMAISAGGMQLPSLFAPPDAAPQPGNFLFLQDPHPYLPVGQVGNGYTGGPSGKSITMEAVTGLAIVIGSVVGGAAIAGAFAPAASAVAPGAYAASGGAPVIASETAAIGTGTAAAAGSTGAAALAAPAVITGTGGTTGLTLTSALAAGKTAVGVASAAMTAQKLLTKSSAHSGAAADLNAQAQQHYEAGYIAAAQQLQTQANQNAGLAQQYQQQARQVANEAGIELPGVGTVPMWAIAALAIGAKLLFF